MSFLHFDCRLRRRSGFALDLAFEAGEGITGLVGPSGSGKTTTLLLIAGLLRPESGVIRLGGETVVDTEKRIHRPPERRGVGLVFQEFALFPHKTVLGNLKYGLRRRGGEGRPLDAVVDVLELRTLLARYPHTLSGGQQQRAAIGRAILSGPGMLLMDEPFNAQHVELRQRIGEYIRRVALEFRLPTLLVSHDTEFLGSLAGRIVRIALGRNLADARAPAGESPEESG
jgi:molybdate transport system ATP-binding protein